MAEQGGMQYDSGWVLARLRRPGLLWRVASALAVTLFGLFSKLVMVVLNSATLHNAAALRRAAARPRGVPLITVANHQSCFDDPGIWGALLSWRSLRWSRVRWTLTAHDVCFTGAGSALGFALCKCVPVVRGGGVYQPAIDFCIERLSRGEWVHLFPEGRVNAEKAHIRYKWGVGRLVAAAARAAAPPLVLPVWHEGLDRVLPNTDYRLRVGQRYFINVGEPIQLDYLLERLKRTNASEEETRKAITDVIQDELLRLRDHTHALIKREVGAHADGLLDNRTDTLVAPRAPLTRAPDSRPERER